MFRSTTWSCFDDAGDTALFAAQVCTLILVVDLRGAIGFSSCGVLIYHLIANIAAFTQPSDQRRFPSPLQVLGVVGCAALVATLPLCAVLGGLAVFTIGLIYRGTRLAITNRSD